MKYLIIDSKNKLNSNETSTNFKYRLSDDIKIQNYIKLSYAAIPNTSYLINSNNNIFRIKFISEGVFNNYILKTGTYSPNDLSTYINNIINRLGFIMSYNNQNLKINITASE